MTDNFSALSGVIALGGQNLSILETEQTTFTGFIQDGGIGGGVGGSLTILSGTGALTLAGINTYTGLTTINSGGTLIMESDTSGMKGNFVDNGTLTFDQPADSSVNSMILGTGVINKTSTNKLNFTGGGSFSGTTNVNQGNLAVNALFPAMNVNVAAGAILSGSGRMNNVDVFGIIAPGNSIGTQQVNNLILNSGSTYQVEILADGVSDESGAVIAGQSDLIIANTATIAQGTTLEVIPLGVVFVDSEVYTILESPQISGTFTTVTQPLTKFHVDVLYNPTNIQLVLEAIPFANLLPSNATNNAFSTADYLDLLDNPTDVQSGSDLAYVYTVLAYATPAELAQGLNTINPATYSNFAVAQQNALLEFRYLIADRLDPYRISLACGCECPCSREFGFWLTPMGSFSRQCSNICEPLGYQAYTAGVGGGVDFFALPSLYLGVAGGYLDNYVSNLSSTPAGGHASRASIGTGYASLYGSWMEPCFYVDAAATVGFGNYRTSRSIFLRSDYATINRTATGHYHGVGYDLYLSAGNVTRYGNCNLNISGALDWVSVNQGSFTEYDAESLNLVMRRRTDNLLRSQLGVSLSYDCPWVIPQIGCAVAYDKRFGDGKYKTKFTGEPGTMVVRGLHPSQWLALPEVKLTTCFNCGPSISLVYEGEYSGQYSTSDFSLNLSMEF